MHRYYVEFILSADKGSGDTLQQALIECGENVEVISLPQSDSHREHNFKIQINTIDPTIVFDRCAEYGRIKSVKINESTSYKAE